MKVQRGEVMMNVIVLHKEYLITKTVLCEREPISRIHIKLLLTLQTNGYRIQETIPRPTSG